jgi:tRNA 2-selenouridine synthase
MTQDIANVAQLAEFDEIVDVRSPAEFALDHAPGALNCPVLDNEERARVGTMYAQESPFKARKVGAAMVARNIARHVEEQFVDRPKSWRPLIYCWRGGQRSAAMTIVLRQIGWDAKRLAGGYKAYRRHVVAEVDRMSTALRFRVVCGLTGSGKSALLRALDTSGAQVLDLEQLAAHRGSVLGELPGEPQPTQKMFESRLWRTLSRFDSRRPVFVEAESRKIGNLRVPESLIARMWDSECVLVEASPRARETLLMREYIHYIQDLPALHAKLDCLVSLHGRERISRWKTLSADGNWQAFLTEVLADHYDPAYRKSTLTHYGKLSQAAIVRILTGEPDEYLSAARSLPGGLESEPPGEPRRHEEFNCVRGPG